MEYKSKIEVRRTCDVCFHDWIEEIDRDRLRAVINNHSLDCPKCQFNNAVKDVSPRGVEPRSED